VGGRRASATGGGVALVVAAILVTAGLVVGLWFVGTGIATRGEGITVSGSASLPATADRAEWSLATSAQGDSTAVAAAQVNTTVAVLVDYLREGGLPASAIAVGGMTTGPVYGSDGPTGRVEASAAITVRTDDVARVAALNEGIGSLLARSGDLLVSNGAPQYSLSTLAELRPEVQRAAVEDARARAEIMVSAVGGRLGPPLALSTGSVQVTALDSVEGEYGSYDLSTVDKSVRAVVSVTFALE